MGLYHVYVYVYVDVTLQGIGQQVLRFDVPVGDDATPVADRAAGLGPIPNEVSAGPYTVRVDPSALRAVQFGAMSLAIMRDGEPAADLQPYLGAGAHVVLVAAEDLFYFHVHPDAHDGEMAAGGHNHGAAAGHDHHAIVQAGHDTHGSHGGHDEALAVEAIAPEMTLHVEPPPPGRYAM